MLESKVFKTNDKNAISVACNLLKSGQVIAIPTDTIYGLACSANDCEAIKRLYEIKGRNEEKPVAICVSDYKDLKHYSLSNHVPDELLLNLLPGAVTIVLYKSKHLNNPYLNPGTEKIGIRIPDFNFIRDVCREFKYPIALTSANKSSEKSTLSINEFRKLWDSVGGVFDGGTLSDAEENRSGSTVIDLSVPNEYKIIRQGMSFNNTIELVQRYGFREIL
jgi:tRNA threonylcarbamoyl adenosine modification protein (Sua5/YciO/YrdC/YwlC family)